MKVLIKLGGTLLDDAATRSRLSAEIATLAREHQVTVVHGGGRQMTRFLEERGIESRFVNGLRVTSPETIDAVLKVFAGSVNHGLVSSLNAAGARAVGLTGIDAGLVEATQLNPELGAVGKVERADPELLNLLCGHRFLPVVACVAGGRDGAIYNVNADQMAVACAAGFAADHLVFLTDVAGVLDGDKQLLPALTLDGIESLISSGVATGGMLAKLRAAASAIQAGVGAVTIAAGLEPGAAGRVLSGQRLGTRIAAGAAC